MISQLLFGEEVCRFSTIQLLPICTPQRTPATKGCTRSLLCICICQNKWAILDGKITSVFTVTLFSTCAQGSICSDVMHSAYDWNYNSGNLHSKSMSVNVLKESQCSKISCTGSFFLVLSIYFAHSKLLKCHNNGKQGNFLLPLPYILPIQQ
jgi:hypothetical protein